MIYHERSDSELARLQRAMATSFQSDERRQEVLDMGKTMADVLMERGEREAGLRTRQQTLIRQLRRRFGEIPAAVVNAVESTTDVDQLDDWLDRFATARTMDELEIPAAR